MRQAGSLELRATARLVSIATLLVLVLAGCSSRTASRDEVPTVVEPTVRTAANATPAAVLLSENLARGKTARASASLADQPPSAAIDGDPETTWGAGSHPAQWIEIDLGASFDLDRLVLLASQDPAGETVHQVWARGDAGDYRLLHEFRGSTADGVALEISPTAGWAAVRYLKVETTEGPSWVAWREVEAYGSPAAAGAVAAGGTPDVIFHNGNLLTMEEDRPVAQAIAAAGDSIVFVGSNSEVLALAGPATTIVDLQGRTLTPGFIDSHSHRISQRYKWGFDPPDEAFQEILRQGWTGITELAVDEAEWNELRNLAAAGRLPVRVDAYLLFNTFEGIALPDWYNAYQPGQRFGSFLRAAGLKFFIDFDSGRVLFFDPPGLAEEIRSQRAEGWQLALKTIGARSHQLALDAIELAEGGEQARDARYRFEHALAQTSAQQERMARLGVIASIQPGVVGVVSSWPDVQAVIVEQEAENVSNWRGLVDAGVLMAGSPLNPDGVNDEYTSPSHVSPLGVAYRGATQIGLAARPPEPWMVEHALTVEEILPLLTIDAAYAIFQEDSRGSLAPGKLADLVILSADPRAVPVEDLLTIETLMTMVGGEVAWCAPGAEALCSGAAGPASTPGAGGAAAPAWPVLGVGRQGPEVFALQYLLRHHGQDIPTDGLFGPVTEQAVKTFQSQRGLGVDGLVGGQTWPALVQGVVVQFGSSGDAVRAAQVLLLEKFGYTDIAVDGLFGRGTEAVVMLFQSEHELASDGLVGASQTWPALISIQP